MPLYRSRTSNLNYIGAHDPAFSVFEHRYCWIRDNKAVFDSTELHINCQLSKDTDSFSLI